MSLWCTPFVCDFRPFSKLRRRFLFIFSCRDVDAAAPTTTDCRSHRFYGLFPSSAYRQGEIPTCIGLPYFPVPVISHYTRIPFFFIIIISDFIIYNRFIIIVMIFLFIFWRIVFAGTPHRKPFTLSVVRLCCDGAQVDWHGRGLVWRTTELISAGRRGRK